MKCTSMEKEPRKKAPAKATPKTQPVTKDKGKRALEELANVAMAPPLNTSAALVKLQALRSQMLASASNVSVTANTTSSLLRATAAPVE